MYLLKWKGYSHADNTWEPSSNLFCKPMLDEYRVKHNLVHPGAHSTSGSSKHLKSRHQAPTLIRSTEHKVLQEHLKAEETISVFMKKPPRVFKKTKKLVLKSLSGVRTLNGNNNWSKQAARHMKRLKRHRRRRKEFRVSIDLENGIIVNKHRSFLDNCATCVSATCVSGDLPGTNGFHKAATVDKPLACPSPRKDNDKSHCDVINVSDDEDLIEVVSDSPILTNNHSTPTKQVNSISGTTLTNYNNIDHHVTCVKHDHTYSCPQEDSSFRHSETPPSVLTPPPSAEPSDHLPNFTSSKEPHIYSVAISPPSSPPSSPLDIPSRCSTPVPPPSEIHEIDSDDEQLTDDCSLNSPNPPPSPPSLNSYKLHWSSTSSLSSDFDMCSVSETSKQTPAQSPAVESASETSKASLQTTAQPPQETTVKLPMGRQLDSCDVNASTTREEQPDASILPRWRKGPVPLPRSFSKRPAGASPLQTKAAKVDYLENGCHKPSKRRQKLSLSLKKALKRSISNDENSNSEQQATAMECVPEKSLYSSICAYKEQLMNWQYELNKQRDGTDDIIYVENDLDMVPPPIDFNYICSNRYAEGVPNPSDPDLVSSLCGCECYYLGRKCGPKSEYCCANMAGSKFAYTPAGKIKVQPGTPIYECNAKCSCPSDCSNRIVQLGRKIPLCIFRTEGRGWGVKTTEPIKPNTFVTEYVGEVITNEEAEKRGKKCDAQGITYLFDLDFEDDNSAFTIDAASYGNISHFFNHSVSDITDVNVKCIVLSIFLTV